MLTHCHSFQLQYWLYSEELGLLCPSNCRCHTQNQNPATKNCLPIWGTTNSLKLFDGFSEFNKSFLSSSATKNLNFTIEGNVIVIGAEILKKGPKLSVIKIPHSDKIDNFYKDLHYLIDRDR